MVSVQEQVKKYLEAEENAMNERIRYFFHIVIFPIKGLTHTFKGWVKRWNAEYQKAKMYSTAQQKYFKDTRFMWTQTIFLDPSSYIFSKFNLLNNKHFLCHP